MRRITSPLTSLWARFLDVALVVALGDVCSTNKDPGAASTANPGCLHRVGSAEGGIRTPLTAFFGWLNDCLHGPAGRKIIKFLSHLVELYRLVSNVFALSFALTVFLYRAEVLKAV
jgi:hypothetical protein